jgi:Rad3-related DNA helicase
VVLDERIVRKRYGSLFTRSLPRRMKVSKDLEDIQAFLGR